MPKNLIRSSNYWTLNKKLVKKLGIETAFLFTNLVEAEHMMKTKDGWFFQTIEKLEEVSTLSRRKQENAIKELEEIGLISLEVKGMPAKRYFKINEKKLVEILLGEKLQFVRNEQTSLYETSKQVCAKRTTSKESTYKESINKSSSVFEFYESHFGLITPFIAEKINHWINDLSEELVLEAMKISVTANKRFNYTEGILKSWESRNIKSLDDLEKKPKKKEQADWSDF